MKKIITRFITTFLILFFMLSVTEDIFFRFSNASYWFEYYPPEVEVVKKIGGEVNFHSNSEFKRDVFVQWYDTLYCSDEEGRIEKFPTQVWTDYVIAYPLGENTSDWSYSNFPRRTKKRICKMCGIIVAKTPPSLINSKGYDKTQKYCTDQFIY